MSVFSESFPPKPTWTAKDMPDCSGKVFLVTGGNSGIGYETVQELLRKGGKVYLAARSQSKGEEAIAAIERETGKRALFLQLDLGSLASIKQAAHDFTSRESQLNVLINNAGVMAPPVEQLTTDGYDLQFGTNVLGHWYLTTLLLPTILATAEISTEKPRIVTLSSTGHRMFAAIEYDFMRDGPARRKASSLRLYSHSKFANIVVSNELARRYGDRVVCIALHPGVIRTNLARHAGTMQKLMNWILAEQWMGAITSLYAATAPEAANLNGKFLIPYARLGTANKNSDDPETGRLLWEWLEEQVKDL